MQLNDYFNQFIRDYIHEYIHDNLNNLNNFDNVEIIYSENSENTENSDDNSYNNSEEECDCFKAIYIDNQSNNNNIEKINFEQINKILQDMIKTELNNRIKNIIDMTKYFENDYKNIIYYSKIITANFKNIYICQITKDTEYLIKIFGEAYKIQNYEDHIMLFNHTYIYIINLKNTQYDIKKQIFDNLNNTCFKENIADIEDLINDINKTEYSINNITNQITELSSKLKINFHKIEHNKQLKKSKKYCKFINELHKLYTDLEDTKKLYICQYTINTEPYFDIYNNNNSFCNDTILPYNSLLISCGINKIIINPGVLMKGQIQKLIHYMVENQNEEECSICCNEHKQQKICQRCFKKYSCYECFEKMQKNKLFNCPLCNF